MARQYVIVLKFDLSNDGEGSKRSLKVRLANFADRPSLRKEMSKSSKTIGQLKIEFKFDGAWLDSMSTS